LARIRTPARLSPSALLGRALSLAAFLPIASRAPMYARLIWELVRDGRMPTQRKVVLAAATAYLVIGRDIIPDRYALVGGLDDLVVVVLAVELFLDGVPSELLNEKLDALGIERAAYDRDIAQVRRLTPGPIRRAIRELPRIIDGAADLAAQTGLGRRPAPGQP
jgi:uncharacterized membrane protein YkvA (DUF1232 family)